MKHKLYIPALFTVLAAMGAYADSAKPLTANQKTSPQPAPKAARATPSEKPGLAAKGLGAPAVQRLANMTPEGRKKALQKLPPERRKMLEDRLHAYDKLTAAQKDKIHALSPEQQVHLRRLYQRFNNFPPERQGALRAETQKMQVMSSAERRARMNSDEFRNRYNQREQALLAELAKASPSN